MIPARPLARLAALSALFALVPWSRGARADEHGSFSSVVRADAVPEPGGQQLIGHDVLHAAPAEVGGQLLERVPGVFAPRAEGDAVSPQIYVRGSDAEQGQDLELKLGAVPLNLPGHIHGHGYADLDFVIPETVQAIKVTEGVYDPTQGDFAINGTLELQLGVPERGFVERTSYGSFNTLRQLILWAPRGQDEGTFVAGQLRRTDGFGARRGSLSLGAMGQYVLHAGAATRVVFQVAAFHARSQSPGVVRRDDVAGGVVAFDGVYDDPGARAQNADASRYQAAVTVEHRWSGGGRTSATVWGVYSDFGERRDLTGYTVDDVRGDLTDQRNRDGGFGASLAHKTAALFARWLGAALEFGGNYRIDRVSQSQDRIAPDRTAWARLFDDSVISSNLALWGAVDVAAGRWVRLRVGPHLEVSSLQASDHLGARGVSTNAAAIGPRVALDVSATPWLTLYAGYGMGFRSASGLQILDGDAGDFSVAHSIDGGVRVRLWGGRIQAAAAGFATFVARDLAFEPTEGRTEDAGATRYPGFSVQGTVRPQRWLTAAASLVWVHPTLTRLPAGGDDDGATVGGLLPYAPTLTARLDASVQGRLARFGRHELTGRVGAGLSVLGARPLPFGQQTSPVGLLDATAALRWWFLELGLDGYNLGNVRYSAIEYVFASDWHTRPASDTPARHLAAGAPIRVMGTLGVLF